MNKGAALIGGVFILFLVVWGFKMPSSGKTAGKIAAAGAEARGLAKSDTEAAIRLIADAIAVALESKFAADEKVVSAIDAAREEIEKIRNYEPKKKKNDRKRKQRDERKDAEIAARAEEFEVEITPIEAEDGARESGAAEPEIVPEDEEKKTPTDVIEIEVEEETVTEIEIEIPDEAPQKGEKTDDRDTKSEAPAPEAEKPADEKPADEKPADEKPAEAPPVRGETGEPAPPDEHASEENPSDTGIAPPEAGDKPDTAPVVKIAPEPENREKPAPPKKPAPLPPAGEVVEPGRVADIVAKVEYADGRVQISNLGASEWKDIEVKLVYRRDVYAFSYAGQAGRRKVKLPLSAFKSPGGAAFPPDALDQQRFPVDLTLTAVIDGRVCVRRFRLK